MTVAGDSQRVAVLGASANPQRYSYRAIERLRAHGHQPLPVHPVLPEIDGLPVSPRLADLHPPVDTLTIYVNPSISARLADEIVALGPRRVIFNPGTGNPALQARLREEGVKVLEACTLVMLSTGQF